MERVNNMCGSDEPHPHHVRSFTYRTGQAKADEVQRDIVYMCVCVCVCIYIYIYVCIGPSLWSSGQSFWLQIQRSRVRFPALPDFLSSSGSGTGSTQPREVN